ncbi:MAG: methyltransferase domain-containing protein [Caldilineaceae bacterium]|nr:methyltransferase domain-containing protein [Caldilineaceae bacterium]
MNDFFSDGSPFLRHPLLTAERTRQEIDFLVDALPLSPGARVLDVGCGFGRHSVELARRRFRVLGIDPAAAMIRAARANAHEAGVVVDFQQVAAEGYFTAEPFDAALCLFTTLGQVPPASVDDNRDLLTTVFDSLKEGGRFALELPQKEPALDALKPSDRFGSDTSYAQIHRSYEAGTGIVTEQFHIVSPDGSQDFHLRYRLFTRQDVTSLLTAAGLQLRKGYDGYTGADLTADSPAMLFICAK